MSTKSVFHFPKQEDEVEDQRDPQPGRATARSAWLPILALVALACVLGFATWFISMALGYVGTDGFGRAPLIAVTVVAVVAIVSGSLIVTLATRRTAHDKDEHLPWE